MTERRVLVVLPHPDDESFGAAGVISQLRRKGTPVTYVCATLGEMGRNMGRPFFANRETLPDVRKKELENACAVLGIEDLRLLGMRDKTLEFEDPDLFADRIQAIIDELNPSRIITFYPGHGIHPDHDACGEAVVRAVSRSPKEKRPVLHCIAIREDSEDILGKPDVVVDVSDVLDIKIEAIKSHRTQYQGIISQFGMEADEQNQELRQWLARETFWVYDV